MTGRSDTVGGDSCQTSNERGRPIGAMPSSPTGVLIGNWHCPAGSRAAAAGHGRKRFLSVSQNTILQQWRELGGVPGRRRRPIVPPQKSVLPRPTAHPNSHVSRPSVSSKDTNILFELFFLSLSFSVTNQVPLGPPRRRDLYLHSPAISTSSALSSPTHIEEQIQIIRHLIIFFQKLSSHLISCKLEFLGYLNVIIFYVRLRSTNILVSTVN